MVPARESLLIDKVHMLFIPTEAKIEELTARTGKKIAALIQSLKEAAIRHLQDEMFGLDFRTNLILLVGRLERI